jgi:tetratricopeptide (TPR) repeat protein
MRAAIVACLLLTTVPAAATAQQGRERYTEPTEAIVVTGIRIQDYRDRLAACLARNCPPNEDIDASLALAEALLLNGDYGDSRAAVQASLRRNRDEAGQYPEPVSDLYRAHSRLSRHMGFDRVALRSTHGILDALQEGLPQEDYRHFTARFELAEIKMAMGRYRAAREELEQLAAIAGRAGRHDVAVMAELRTLWFDYISLPHGGARSRLEEMSQWTDPGRRLQSVGARVLMARIYRSERDARAADALLAEIGRGTSARRRLIHAPRYTLLRNDRDQVLDQELATAVRFGNVASRASENYEGKWIDVGFWVQPDGRVSELEVLRTGGDTVWARPLLEAIRGRLYSTGEEPTYRLERYTLTAAWAFPENWAGGETSSGSRLPQRSPRARVEYLDLTVGDPPPPPSAPSDGTI